MPRCYLCEQRLPEGQSCYVDHGVEVCLNCFRQTPRCSRCRFPSRQLSQHPTLGMICEFCDSAVVAQEIFRCYLCQTPITEHSPYFEGHGVRVCKPCFQRAPRCFLCRFPHSEEQVVGVGNVCEFCTQTVLNRQSDLTRPSEVIQQFLQKYDHSLAEIPPLRWVDWRVLVGMQLDGHPPEFPIQFLDELLHYAYPLFYLKGAIYIMPRISKSLFLTHMAGQLTAADLCQRHRLPHLLGKTAFHRVARGWTHGVAWRTARQLKFSTEAQQLSRWPENFLSGDFQKLRNTGDLRGEGELRKFVQLALNKAAQRDLTEEMRW